MSPLFLVGCGLLVAAVLLGATGAPAAIWVLLGAAGIALFWRGATTTPRRGIRSHSGASRRGRGARAAQPRGKGATPAAGPGGKPKGRRGSGAGRGHR